MIEVRGYIDNLIVNEEYKNFFASIEDQEGFLMTMIDAPIIQNGKPVGVINDIDFEDMTWSGVIWGNTQMEIDLCNGGIQSIHLIK